MVQKLLEAFAPIVKSLISQIVAVLLDKLLENEPERGALALVSLYPVIDVELQTVVEQTETALDDSIVDGVMEAMEKVAAKNNISLPNLDND